LLGGALRERRINHRISAHPNQHAANAQRQAHPNISFALAPRLQKVPAHLDRKRAHREQCRPKIRAHRAFHEGHQTRFQQVERNVQHAENQQGQHSGKSRRKHRLVPNIPGRAGLHIRRAGHLHRHKFFLPGQPGVQLPRPGFEQLQAVFMHARLLLKPLEIAGMMMHEHRPVIGVHRLEPFAFGQACLVLDKLQVHRGPCRFPGAFSRCQCLHGLPPRLRCARASTR
jgi:hypothetical protein